MRRVMGLGLAWLMLAGVAFSANEQIVFSQSANGTRTTRPLTVQDGWEVQWKAEKDLAIYLLDPEGKPIESLSSAKGAGTGSTYRAKGGTFSLKILSAGEWTITVVQLP